MVIHLPSRIHKAAGCHCLKGLLFAALLLHQNLPAQRTGFEEAWRWVRFTEESGLPSDRIREVFETRDGTVWVATSAGIAWFDDFRWIPIDSSLGLPPSGFADIIGELRDSLVLGSTGGYFIGTRHGFRPLTTGAPAGAGILGGKFLLVRNASLYSLDHGSLKLFQPSSALTKDRTITIVSTAPGGFWLNLMDGLYRWEGDRFQSTIMVGTHALGTPTIVENGHGTGLLAIDLPFESRGLWEWDKHSPMKRNPTERVDNIKAMDISEDDEVVAVYLSDEVRIRTGNRWSPVRFNYPSITDIGTVKFRKNGDLWVGTDHGLFLYRRSSSRWTYWSEPPPDLRNSVNEILRTRNGDFWLGTSDGIEIHRTNGRVEHISTVKGTPLCVITGLAEDFEGNVWASSGASFPGAFRWDGKSWDRFSVSDSGGVYFHKIRLDRKGRLWFLGIGEFFPPMGGSQPGAFVLENGRFRRWGESEGLISGRVYSFADGSDGSLWFGTFSGLSRWKNGAWTHWSSHRGLHAGRVFTLALDKSNKPWFGDYDDRSGLATIDENDSVKYLTSADGPPSQNIWDIKFDDFGKMWVVTRSGVSRYDNGVWSNYDEKSGLSHVALWPVLPLEHEVYVGTAGKGVAILHRGETFTPDPHIFLNNPLMEGNNVILRWKASAYWGEVPQGEVFSRYRINDQPWSSWKQEEEVSLPSLPPGNYSYVVQAKGVFGNFDPQGAQGAFTVPLPLHLRPVFLMPVGALAVAVVALGITLLVRKRNHNREIRKSEEKFRTVTEMTASAIFIFDNSRILFVNTAAEALTGRPKEELVSMVIGDVIHPSDHSLIQENGLPDTESRRYECRLITRSGDVRWVDFISGWISFQGIRVRIGTASEITERKHAEEKLRLLASELSSTEERERRRLASYLHDTIGQTLAFSKMKIRLLQKSSTPHELDSRLQEIRDLIDQSIADTRSLTYELSPPILYELDFVAALEWLMNQIAGKHHLEITLEDDKRPKLIGDELRIFLFHATREVLVNAAKHAEATRVVISLRESDGYILLKVQDNGVGFDSSRASPAADMNGGFGLFNIRERLRSIGGMLDIDSVPGRGTSVSITVPSVIPDSQAPHNAS